MAQNPLMLVVAATIGALLIASAWAKVRDPRAFLRIVGEYPVFADHPGAARMASNATPWAELLLGLLLLSCRSGLVRVGFWGALGFVGLATLALAQRAARGEKRIRCGCAGNLEETHSLRFLLLRNCLLLAILTAGLAFPHPAVAPALADQAALCAAGFGAVLTFKLLGAAWTARRAVNEWRMAG
jgi:hypothetical protein